MALLRFISPIGQEREIVDADDLYNLIQAGEFNYETRVHDESSGQWIRAHDHPLFIKIRNIAAKRQVAKGQSDVASFRDDDVASFRDDSVSESRLQQFRAMGAHDHPLFIEIRNIAAKSEVPKCPVPKSPVPKSPVPKSPVSKSPVPKSPVPKSPVPKSPVPESPVPESPVPESPVPESQVPESHVPKSQVPKRKVAKSQSDVASNKIGGVSASRLGVGDRLLLIGIFTYFLSLISFFVLIGPLHDGARRPFVILLAAPVLLVVGLQAMYPALPFARRKLKRSALGGLMRGIHPTGSGTAGIILLLSVIIAALFFRF